MGAGHPERAQRAAVKMKRLSVPAALAAAAVLTISGSALAASAQPSPPPRSVFRRPLRRPRTAAGSSTASATRATSAGSTHHRDEHAVLQVHKRGDRRRAGAAGYCPQSKLPRRRSRVGVRHPQVSGTPTNQLLRIRADGSGFAVLRSFSTALQHDGGRIMFGPDGKLYVVIGDNGSPALAQNLAIMAGKILRLNADGTVPSDNPRPGSPIIAYGIRNSFGFTFDPQRGRLWETDNGPQCNDEINLVPRLTLSNLGWGPSGTCSTPPPAPRNTNQDGPSPVLPKLFFAGRLGLTGAAFCNQCGLSSNGRLFFGDFNAGTIRRATLTSARTGIASGAPFYDHPAACSHLRRRSTAARSTSARRRTSSG